MRVLAFAGYSEAGKSTAAKYVNAMYGSHFIKPDHIKQPMMEMAAPLIIRLGVNPDDVERYLDGDLKFAPLPKRPDLTGKKILQVLGKEFRDGVDPTSKIWMEMWRDDAAECSQKYNRHILMESHRFPVEGEVLRDAGDDFVTVWIDRPGYGPNGGENYEERLPTKYTVNNDGSLEQLYWRVDQIVIKEGFLNVAA